MTRLRSTCVLLGLGLAVGFSRGAAAASRPTFEQRVAAQAALEEVYWRHRTWPEANQNPKPPLRAVLTDVMLRERVREYLDASASLESRWGRAIAPADLQAEIDRMAAHTKNPDLLRELWAALGNDPALIAECLARPALARRLDEGGGPGRPEPPAGAGHGTSLTSAPYTLPAITGAACTDDTWRSFTFHPFPYAKSDHVVVWTGTEMIVWGGVGNVREGMRYNPSIDTWTAIRNDETAPLGRARASAVWTGLEMIVWGGNLGGNGHPNNLINTGGRYDPVTDTWMVTRADATAPAGRMLASAFWTGHEMIIWGGYDDSGGAPPLGARYDPASDSWTPMSGDGMQLMSRVGSSVVWSGTELIVWGGALPLPNVAPFVWTGFNNGGRYNPDTDTWTTISSLNAPSARQDHSVVWIGSEMIVTGGQYFRWHTGCCVPKWDTLYVFSGSRYNPATDSWTAISPNSKALVSQSAFWTGNDVLVYPIGVRYRPQTDVWSNMSPFPTPYASSSPGRAIWADTVLIAYGEGGSYNFGGRYDPVTDSWLPTAGGVLGPPVQKTAAVWTGAEMIVWGGHSSLSGPDIGARYDPALDQWFTVRHDATAPSAREGHTLVWTGTEMIVWGGWDLQGPGTGGRYNPTTDTWKPTAVDAATPTVRMRHSAIWTGTEMIVWGGMTRGNNFYFGDGGRYNPATDSWRTMASGPTPRIDHAAVWANSRMVVWGGQSLSGGVYGVLNTGGRYDPASDTWLPTRLDASTPSARTGHTAVFTGSHMIVWGGAGYPGNSNLVADGGSYDAVGDTWQTIPVGPGSPTARRNHAAVSSGRHMIVWGGATETYPYLTSTGGRYDPTTGLWTATSMTGAPTATAGLAQDAPIALWTGTEMIIYGTYSARYCSCTIDSTYYRDDDGDGYGDPAATLQACGQPAGYVTNSNDCNDADASSWATPGEVPGFLATDQSTFAWQPPGSMGGASVSYDVIRSDSPGDFETAATCIATDTAALSVSDDAVPPPGAAFYYLVRGTNSCPNGQGSLGTDSSGHQRTARSCP